MVTIGGKKLKLAIWDTGDSDANKNCLHCTLVSAIYVV